jgi:hypothetical protein
MMSRRQVIVSVVAVVSIVGIGFSAIPFISALKPSASAGATLPHIEISNLLPGTYRFEPYPLKNRFFLEMLILRDFDKRIFVYWIPKSNEGFIMPDIHWWRWGGTCLNFGPDSVHGKLVKEGLIQCHDKNISDFSQSSEWKWTYQGKNLGKYTDDMEGPPFNLEGNYVVIGKRR